MILKEFPEKKKQGKSNKDVITAVEEESSENYSKILGIVENQLPDQSSPKQSYFHSPTPYLLLLSKSIQEQSRKNPRKSEYDSQGIP